VIATLLAVVAAAKLAAEPAPALRVGKVEVRTLGVFTSEEAKGKLRRTLEKAHVTTRPSLVRKLLLFRQGDPFDAEKLAETERNLRALPFLKSARVTASPPHDGIVDVTVETQDIWTLSPGIPLALSGGTATYGVELLERDLLGRGIEVSFTATHDVERVTRTLRFSDPVLFGAYWNGLFAQSWNSDGERTRAAVTRPFVSVAATRADDYELDFFGQTTRTYAGGDVAAAYHQRHRSVALERGWALAVRERRAQRLTLGLDVLEDRFRALPDRPSDPLPDASADSLVRSSRSVTGSV